MMRSGSKDTFYFDRMLSRGRSVATCLPVRSWIHSEYAKAKLLTEEDVCDIINAQQDWELDQIPPIQASISH